MTTLEQVKLEASSFFAPGEWRPVTPEMFQRSVDPFNILEPSELIEALEAGQCILSALGTLKFRKVSEAGATGES